MSGGRKGDGSRRKLIAARVPVVRLTKMFPPTTAGCGGSHSSVRRVLPRPVKLPALAAVRCLLNPLRPRVCPAC